jgi:hypothetical protein
MPCERFPYRWGKIINTDVKEIEYERADRVLLA